MTGEAIDSGAGPVAGPTDSPTDGPTVRMVLLALSGEAPGEGLLAGAEALRAGGAHLTLLSRRRPAPGLAAAVHAHRLVPPGRMPLPAHPVRLPGRLRKVAFTPDRLPAAVRVLRDPTLRAPIERAQVLVALDAAAVPAAWLAARRRPGLVALHGLPAAVTRWGA